MKKTLGVLVLSVLLCCAVGGAVGWAGPFDTNPPSFEVQGGWWLPHLDGHLQTSAATSNTVDFKNTLALPDSTAGLNFALLLHSNSKVSWRVEYYQAQSSGANIVPAISSPIVMHPVVLNAGDSVTSSLNMSAVALWYQQNFWRSDDGELNWMLGVKNYDWNLSVNNLTQGVSTSFRATQFVPQLGISGKTRITDQLIGVASLAIGGGGAANRNGSLVDAEGGLEWKFNPNWNVGATYKYERLNVTTTFNQTLDETNGGARVYLNYAY